MRFYLVPTLESELYLGIDFWSLFHLAPQIVSELSTDNLNSHLPNLSTLEQTQLVNVKEMFLSFEKHGLGQTQILEHEIDTGQHAPIKQKHYNVSPAVQDLIYAELDRMLEMGVIEESASPWSSPVHLVRKPNGKNRLCLDCRKLNAVTKKDAYPLPLIDGLLGRLSDTKYISAIDLKDAFWQIPLSMEAREKTAFTVFGRALYQFRVMPFGLCNAPQTMSRLMDRVVPHKLKHKIFVYLDDLLIVSATFAEHIDLLATTARLLSEAGLSINLTKSKFVMREIPYLGFIVGETGLRADPSKIEAICNFPAPTSVKQTRRLLGMAGWYRRFIPNFSDITAPITNLLKKARKFEWNDNCQEAFEHLKVLLTSAPVLVNPDYTKPFHIRCDASTEGIGGVLYQVDEEGNERPISYVSKKLNSAQRNYSITELECLAAIISIQKFRPYIELFPFTVKTDHASLRWLMSLKDVHGRLARWSLKLQPYNFSIVHEKGNLNVVPDALSRAFCDSQQELDKSILSISALLLNPDHFQESEYMAFKAKIAEFPNNYPNLKIHDDKIYVRTEPSKNCELSDIPVWKLWVPKDLRLDLLIREHCDPSASHGGVRKTVERIRRFYFWPGLNKHVREFISACVDCKMSKAPNVILRPPMSPSSVPERPMQKLYVDLLGPYPRSKSGNTTILIATDKLTKFVFLKPLSKGSASKIVDYLRNEIFHVYGVPEVIHSDNGPQFVGKEFKQLVDLFGITHIRTAIYSPQSNASERVNRSIVAAIRTYVKTDHRNWDTHLSEIGAALRDSIHESASFSPHVMLFGYQRIKHGEEYKLLRQLDCLGENLVESNHVNDRMQELHARVRRNLAQAYEKYAHYYNLRSRSVSYPSGSIVYVREHPLSQASANFCAKFAPKFRKARVRSQVGNVNYEIEDENGKLLGVYHGKDIKS